MKERLTNQKTLELKIKHDGRDVPATKIYQRLFEYEKTGLEPAGVKTLRRALGLVIKKLHPIDSVLMESKHGDLENYFIQQAEREGGAEC